MALPVSAEPRWKALDTGLAIGYRRNKRGGAWLARRYDSERQAYAEAALGRPDDAQDADGSTILNFSQAQATARAWWLKEERGDDHEEKAAGPYTVGDALRDYLEARDGKAREAFIPIGGTAKPVSSPASATSLWRSLQRHAFADGTRG